MTAPEENSKPKPGALICPICLQEIEKGDECTGAISYGTWTNIMLHRKPCWAKRAQLADPPGTPHDQRTVIVVAEGVLDERRRWHILELSTA